MKRSISSHSTPKKVNTLLCNFRKHQSYIISSAGSRCSYFSRPQCILDACLTTFPSLLLPFRLQLSWYSPASVFRILLPSSPAYCAISWCCYSSLVPFLCICDLNCLSSASCFFSFREFVILGSFLTWAHLMMTRLANLSFEVFSQKFSLLGKFCSNFTAQSGYLPILW